MRRSSLLWVLLCAAAALAVAVGVSAAGAGASTRATASSWTDVAGDALGGAPDLTAVQITNDAAGVITTSVTVPMVSNTVMIMLLDTNIDASLDHGIMAVGVGPGVASPMVIDLASEQLVSVPSLQMGSTPTAVTFSFAKADLGITDAFAFKLVTMTEAQLNAGHEYGDELPDGNVAYLYALTNPPAPAPTPTPTPTPTVVKPVIGAPVATPKTAVAGKRFTVVFSVTRSDTGGPLMAGKMVCDPSVAGKVIRHAESFKAGKAKLAFTVPKTANGKLLKVKVTIRAGKQSATRIATYHVR